MQTIVDNLIIGIIGGIISGVFVSRFFILQDIYKSQINYADNLIRRLLFACFSLQGCKTLLETQHDIEEIAIKKVKEGKCKSVEEFYEKHSDQEWVPVSEGVKMILNNLLTHLNSETEKTEEIELRDNELKIICNKADGVFEKIEKIEDCRFSTFNNLIDEISDIELEYKRYRQKYNRKFIWNVLLDKVSIFIFIFLIILIGVSMYLRFFES